MFRVGTAVVWALFAMVAQAQDQNTTMMAPMVDSNATSTDPGPSTMMPDPTTTMMVMMNTTAGDKTGIDTTTTTDALVTTDNTTMVTSPDTTTDTTQGTTSTPPVSSTPVPCNDSIGRLDEIYAFTSTNVFTDSLTQSEQILVYEVLAAAEGCKMTAFITPETAERIFKMLGSLPVRHVYILLDYMAEALANEGVVVPV